MLSVEEKARCLEKGVFGALEAAARLALAERMGERQIEDGQTLFMEGEPGSHVFVIVSGEVEVRRGETVLAVLGPGELIGEMAVLGSGLRTASARARGTARFLFLKDRAIRLLIQQIPEIAFAVFGVLVERLTVASDLAAFLAGERTPIGRVEALSGDIEGRSFPLYRERSVLGRSLGSLAADGFRVALPTSAPELRERHASVIVADGKVLVEPLDGPVTVGGETVDEAIAVYPGDEVGVGGLRLRIVASAPEAACLPPHRPAGGAQ